MNPDEYQKLARVDQEHWFYRGKRQIVRCWLDRFVQLRPEDVLIDAGMGTGTWAVEMASRCRVIGIDDHAESLAVAGPRLKALSAQVIQSNLQTVALPSATAKVVTLLDVLEHIDDDAGAFREMLRLTQPGGLLVATVPALPWLWSDWDEVLHHRRRYTKRGLLELVQQSGVRVLHCAYFNTFALLPIALVRSYRRLRPSRANRPRLEDRVPPRLLNECLYQMLVWPACRVWFPAPFGVSLLAVVQR